MKINLNGFDLEEFDDLPSNEKIKVNKEPVLDSETLKRKKKTNKPKRGKEDK